MDKLAYYEILLLTIPVIVLFLAIYLLFRQFFQNQLKLQMAQAGRSHGDSVVRLKLHAYERLMLFCERIEMKNLVGRLHQSSMKAKDLKAALIVTVHQEFEYNLSQQLYVSSQLWQIVELAKSQMIEIITHVGATVKEDAPATDLSNTLLAYFETQKHNPVETAKSAIRQESRLLL
jgi:hypothetical protein